MFKGLTGGTGTLLTTGGGNVWTGFTTGATTGGCAGAASANKLSSFQAWAGTILFIMLS